MDGWMDGCYIIRLGKRSSTSCGTIRSHIQLMRRTFFSGSLLAVYGLVVALTRFQGHLLYGINAISIFSDGLRAVVSDCAKAAKSFDARDKYFLSSASETDVSPAKAVRSEMPSLEAAKAALAATVSELVDALPRLEICGVHNLSRQRTLQNAMQTRRQAIARVGDATLPGVVDIDDLNVLLIEARAAIISIRSALA